MFKLLYDKKNIAGFTPLENSIRCESGGSKRRLSLTGFTMIELVIVILLFTLVSFAIIGVAAKTYWQSGKIHNQAEIYGELKILNARIAKKANYGTYIKINPDNDGFTYTLNARQGEIFYSDGALWEKSGGVSKKLSCLKIDEADFIAEDGYMWGHIRIADKNEYFGIKLP